MENITQNTHPFYDPVSTYADDGAQAGEGVRLKPLSHTPLTSVVFN